MRARRHQPFFDTLSPPKWSRKLNKIRTRTRRTWRKRLVHLAGAVDKDDDKCRSIYMLFPQPGLMDEMYRLFCASRALRCPPFGVPRSLRSVVGTPKIGG